MIIAIQTNKQGYPAIQIVNHRYAAFVCLDLRIDVCESTKKTSFEVFIHKFMIHFVERYNYVKTIFSRQETLISK